MMKAWGHDKTKALETTNEAFEKKTRFKVMINYALQK